MGNSSTTQIYNLYDYTPEGGYNYYRITEVDIYGNQSESQIVQAYLSPADAFVMQVYPNPLSDVNNLNVEIQGAEGLELQLILSDNLGRELYTKVHLVESDFEVIKAVDDYHTIPDGLYYIKATNQMEYFHEKIIIEQ